jgi:hypothetical protein
VKRHPKLPSHDKLHAAAFFGGFLLIAAGVALVSIAAGLMAAGVMLVGGAVAYELTGGTKDADE